MDQKIADKIELWGVTQVSDEELLSVLVGQEKAAKLLRSHENTLFSCKEQGLRSLATYDVYGYRSFGLSKLESLRLEAAVEIGRRLAVASAIEADHVTSPGDGAQLLTPLLRHKTHEVFVVALLNTKNRLIKIIQIAEGSLTSAVVHPREVFAPAVVAHAACILVAHNHPSGDPDPSTEDRNLTRALEEASQVLGIPLLDHLVIGDGRYYSFKEHGEL